MLNAESLQEINAVIKSHMAWRSRIQAIIDGASTEEITVEAARADNQCELGKWIYGRGYIEFGDEPDFVQLRTLHTQFHESAGQAVELAQAEQKDEAQKITQSGGYAATSRSIVMALTGLYQKAREKLKP